MVEIDLKSDIARFICEKFGWEVKNCDGGGIWLKKETVFDKNFAVYVREFSELEDYCRFDAKEIENSLMRYVHLLHPKWSSDDFHNGAVEVETNLKKLVAGLKDENEIKDAIKKLKTHIPKELWRSRKLTDKDKQEIKVLRDKGEIYRNIAKMYAVSYSCVYWICNEDKDRENREAWKRRAVDGRYRYGKKKDRDSYILELFFFGKNIKKY